jgi:hypothetical protein
MATQRRPGLQLPFGRELCRQQALSHSGERVLRIHRQEIPEGKASLRVEGLIYHGDRRHLAGGSRQPSTGIHDVDDRAGLAVAPITTDRLWWSDRKTGRLGYSLRGRKAPCCAPTCRIIGGDTRTWRSGLISTQSIGLARQRGVFRTRQQEQRRQRSQAQKRRYHHHATPHGFD